jgi:hypothetical protein
MHQPFASVEAMIAPTALSGLLGRPVASVDRSPLTPKGHSSTGATFEGVRVDGEASPSLVVKTVDRATDWVAVATGDVADREVLVWESGLLDRLPSGMGHAVVAAARFAGGSALLMRNRSDDFMADDDPLSPARHTGVLQSVASMHAAFFEDVLLERADPGLCTLETFLGHLSPARLPALRDAVPGHFIIDLIGNGWERLPELIDAGVAYDLESLSVDPSPVVRALSRYPRTLLHADVRPQNVAYDGGRATLVDWARPCAGPPGIDVVYYLVMLDESAPVSPDDSAGEYRELLQTASGADRPLSWWDDHLDICFAAVLATMVPAKVEHHTRFRSQDDPEHAGVPWWAARAMRGLRLIEQA